MVSGAQFEGRGGEDVICGPDGRVEGRLHNGEWKGSPTTGGGSLSETAICHGMD
jgi:hypothetical protein